MNEIIVYDLPPHLYKLACAIMENPEEEPLLIVQEKYINPIDAAEAVTALDEDVKQHGFENIHDFIRICRSADVYEDTIIINR